MTFEDNDNSNDLRKRMTFKNTVGKSAFSPFPTILFEPFLNKINHLIHISFATCK